MQPPVFIQNKCGNHLRQPVAVAVQHRQRSDATAAVTIAYDVNDQLDGGGELAVQRVTTEPCGQRERLQSRGQRLRGVGVHGAAATVVTGVERGKKIDDLGTPDLADDESVRPHPQRLAHQLAQVHLPSSLDVGLPGLEPHNVRVGGSQLAGVLDEHDAFLGGDLTQQAGQQRRLA